MIAVTTYPEWAWDVYADIMVTSFLKHWPIPLLLFADSPPPLSHDRLGVRPLSSLTERNEFLAGDHQWPPGRENFYMFDAKRFCHKVFCQIEALKEYDQVIWLDADVATFRDVPDEMIDHVMEEDINYLGRQGNYSETGFIGYNNPGHEFIDRYRSYYTDREIYKLPYWTDCHAFDAARGFGGNNLTPQGRGVEDVFSQCILGDYCTHLKGNRKFNIQREEASEI